MFEFLGSSQPPVRNAWPVHSPLFIGHQRNAQALRYGVGAMADMAASACA
jgi:hypothetical protein